MVSIFCKAFFPHRLKKRNREKSTTLKMDLKLYRLIVIMADTNIDNYSVENILSIFNLTDPTPFNVRDVANALIAKMTSEGNPDLVVFFTQARDKVLADIEKKSTENLEVENESFESLEKIWTEGSFEDNAENHARYFIGDSHFPVDKKMPPLVNSAINHIPVIATHIITIDSQYRSTILPYIDNSLSNSYNTNFTFNITNPINKTVSLRLYSYTIPTTWYAFSASAGNTFFMYNGVIITIPDGNYTASTLVNQINTLAAEDTATIGLTVSYNPSNNKISFKNNDPLSGLITVTFYVQKDVINYNNCGTTTLGSFQTLGINTTLGWLMGFRTTPDPITGDMFITIGPNDTIEADVQPDTYGPKYFVLSLEDYSNQRLSSGLFNITTIKNYASLSGQEYFNTINVGCKLREGSLTQAQQFSINAVTNANATVIKNNLSVGFNNKLSGPNSGTAFAIIPLRDINNIRPYPYTRFGAELIPYVRRYVGPTYLQRFTVTLTDDKGVLVNLYDNDWSFSLIVEEQLN